MKPDWAELYNEHVATYYERDGQCQNPHCGHRPIHLRHVLRHKYSGDVLEIGHICFLRWQAYYGLIENELLEYQRALKHQQYATRYVVSMGGTLTGSQYDKFAEATAEGSLMVCPKCGSTKVRRIWDKGKKYDQWICQYCGSKTKF